MMARCSSCGAVVEWVLTVRGKRMPLDKLPDREKGNVLIATRRDADLYDTVPGRAVVLRDGAAHAERSVGRELFTSHFATCPHADHHRRRR